MKKKHLKRLWSGLSMNRHVYLNRVLINILYIGCFANRTILITAGIHTLVFGSFEFSTASRAIYDPKEANNSSEENSGKKGNGKEIIISVFCFVGCRSKRLLQLVHQTYINIRIVAYLTPLIRRQSIGPGFLNEQLQRASLIEIGPT